MTSIWLLLAVLICTARGQRRDICQDGVCDCQQGENTATILVVKCVCDNRTQELILNSGLLAKFPFINRFTVQDCSDLVLTKDSFKYAHQLQVLSIKRTRNVNLAMGVFSSLNSLNIEDVEYLRFQPGSFMGASGVATISIRRSFISELPIFALYNLTGLRTFELDNVNLGNIKSQSLHLQMDNYQSRFIMTNCTLFVPDQKSQKFFNVTRRNFCISSCNRSFSAMESELSSVCRTESSHVVLGSEALCPMTTVEPKAEEVTRPSRDDRVLHFSTEVPSHHGGQELHYSGSGTRRTDKMAAFVGNTSMSTSDQAGSLACTLTDTESYVTDIWSSTAPTLVGQGLKVE
uniref:Uncharacterized protein n=1 Tax=Timema monikensis TaxID=170555 RepID=A0A7R9EDH4_9NEOP|nr:unnamed protein product [Timema monikensis]